MFLKLIFCFTAMTTIFFITFVIALLCGRDIEIPTPISYRNKSVTFMNIGILLPSLMYQIYFWSEKLGVFNV